MFTSNNYPARKTLTVTLVAFSLLVASCGGSGDDDVTAEAASAGVARSFCDAVADLGATIQANAASADQASAAAATMELMPADAPAYATSYFQAIADTTQLQSTGADSTAAEAAWAEGQHLQVSAFLGSKCPDSEFTSSASFQGMIAMGMNMQATGVSAQPATATTVAGGDTNSDDTNSDDTTSQATETTAAPATTTTPAAAPGESTVTESGVTMVALSEGGQTGSYWLTEFTIGTVFASDADRYSVFDAAPELGDNDRWLVVEINGETLETLDLNYDENDFFLTSPEGLTMGAVDLSDRFGESTYRLEFDGRENKSTFIRFETPELVTDLAGWQLQIKVDDAIPTFIPLSGTSIANDTTISVPPVPVFEATGDNVWDVCASRYDVEMLESFVTAEAFYDKKIRRAQVGNRLLVVKFDIKNITEEEPEKYCPDGADNGFDPQYFRISVDGRVTTPDALEVESIEPGTTVAGQVVYVIPNTAKSLQIVGETDDVVYASWNVELPLLPGE